MNFQSPLFLIKTLILWSNQNLQDLVVTHKGHDKWGLLLIRQNLIEGKVKIWIQESDQNGFPRFRRRFPENQTNEFSDDYIARELERDEDLWVLVFDNSMGALPEVLEPVDPHQN